MFECHGYALVNCVDLYFFSFIQCYTIIYFDVTLCRFKMEKVGQYLKKEDLAHPSNLGKNPWVKFVKSSAALRDSKVLYPVVETKSLLQLQEALESTLETALNVIHV